MKIKKNIISLFLIAFLLIIVCRSYAELTIGDMDFLLEDETAVENEKEVGDSQDQKEGIKGRFKSYFNSEKGIFESEAEDYNIDAVKSLEEDEAITKSALNTGTGVNILRDNLVLIIGGGVCGLFFIAILYFFYLKTKKLAEEAQVSKDLAEKYFYNIQEHRERYEELKKEVESKIISMDEKIDIKVSLKVKELDKVLVTRIKEILVKLKNGEEITDIVIPKSVNSEISDIITSVEKVFDEKEKETKISDDKSTNNELPVDESANKIGLVLKKERVDDVDKEKVDVMENVSDNDKLEDKEVEKKLAKSSPTAIPESDSDDALGDISEITEDKKEENDIPESIASSNKDSGKDQLDVLESLFADDESGGEEIDESEGLLKEKDGDKDVSGDDLIGGPRETLLDADGKNELIELEISDDDILEALESTSPKEDTNEDTKDSKGDTGDDSENIEDLLPTEKGEEIVIEEVEEKPKDEKIINNDNNKL